MRALGDRVGDDAIDADDGDEERDQPERNQQIARKRQSAADDDTTSDISRISVTGKSGSSARTAARTSAATVDGGLVVWTMNEPPLVAGL